MPIHPETDLGLKVSCGLREPFRLSDARHDDVALRTGMEFFFEKGPPALTIFLLCEVGFDFLSSGREFSDRGEIQVAEERHGDRTRDRRRGHDEVVRRFAGTPKRRTLIHAEFMLLVDDHHREFREIHVFLKQRLRSDYELCFSGRDHFQPFSPFCRFQAADQFYDLDRTVCEEFPEGPCMLSGQDFRRRHDGSLKSMCDGQKKRVDRHGRLSASDVTLDQTIHRPAGNRVARHVADRFELSLSQIVRKKLANASIDLRCRF